MRFGVWANCAMIFCTLAAAFFFYVFLLCALSPDRLHILRHEDKDADATRYATAWTSAAVACFLYALVAGLLWGVKLSGPDGASDLLLFFRRTAVATRPASTYELEALTR